MYFCISKTSKLSAFCALQRRTRGTARLQEVLSLLALLVQILTPKVLSGEQEARLVCKETKLARLQKFNDVLIAKVPMRKRERRETETETEQSERRASERERERERERESMFSNTVVSLPVGYIYTHICI